MVELGGGGGGGGCVRTGVGAHDLGTATRILYWVKKKKIGGGNFRTEPKQMGGLAGGKKKKKKKKEKKIKPGSTGLSAKKKIHTT